jgi:hypothetical protein
MTVFLVDPDDTVLPDAVGAGLGMQTGEHRLRGEMVRESNGIFTDLAGGVAIGVDGNGDGGVFFLDPRS